MKRDPLVLFGFVCNVQRNNEKETIFTNLDAFPVAGLGSSSSLVVLVVSAKRFHNA